MPRPSGYLINPAALDFVIERTPGMTRTKLCRTINKSTGFLADAENRRTGISGPVVAAIADVLAVAPEVLFPELSQRFIAHRNSVPDAEVAA